MRLYGCGYNNNSHKPGIWLFDLEEGLLGEYSGAESPSFCITAQNAQGQRLLYAACELPDKAQLALFLVDEAGGAHFRDKLTWEEAAGTCYVLRHPSGLCLYGANYNSGSICSCALKPDGALGEPWPLLQHYGHGPARATEDPNYDRQLTAHVHTLSFVPGTEILAAVDLGEDLITLYKPHTDGSIDGSCLVGEVAVPAGCGPRIVAYHPTLSLAAVVCELSCEVLLYALESPTEWRLTERHGLINGKTANWQDPDPLALANTEEYPPLAAHAEFSADGRFLYVSTRGTNTITIFAIDASGNAQEISTVSCGGESPRHFAISPDQRHFAVANQRSNEITVFERNPLTGQLTERTHFACTQPSCVIWDTNTN